MRADGMTNVFGAAQQHLARRDRILRDLIKTIGPCTLRRKRQRFDALARSIISQQISTRAAAAIAARLEQNFPGKRVSPRGILDLPEDKLRLAGLSAGKIRALYDLAEKVHNDSVPLARLHKLKDEEVIASLIPVRGIGRWTAEMFLIFSLGRLDILPVDDYGLRAGVQRQYGLGTLPGRTALTELAEPWRPYRSIATWYIWRSLGFVPQSRIQEQAPREDKKAK